MKLQLASDLHLEFFQQAFPGERLISPLPDADLLILPGDIANGLQAIELFGNWPVPVLYVAGNHEFYGRGWERTRKALRDAARGTSVAFLDNDVADLTTFSHWTSARKDELARLRFLGTTLWTDYRLPVGRSQRHLMEHAEKRLADHRVIQTEDGTFRAHQALEDHERSREWLEAQLDRPFEGKTIVISHHGPHRLSVHPRYMSPDSLHLNAAFVSNLAPLLGKCDLWLHGHVHDSFDYVVGRSRVVTNPCGYALNRGGVRRSAQLVFENPQFKPDLLVEV